MRTDVDNVSMIVKHNVSVVPVLELQEVKRNRVRSQAFNKVVPRFLVLDRVARSKLINVIA